MKLTDRIGAILVIAAKPRIQSSVRSALTPRYGRVLTAETVREARKAAERERIALMVVFTPLKDGEEIPRLFDMASRRGVPAAYIVSREVYGETVYRLAGQNIFVLAYPLQLDQVVQTVGFLHQTQLRLAMLFSEQERLQRQLQDTQIACRVKCLLVQKRGMTEEEAHHLIEQEAMNTGLPKREAALKLLKELGQEL